METGRGCLQRAAHAKGKERQMHESEKRRPSGGRGRRWLVKGKAETEIRMAGKEG